MGRGDTGTYETDGGFGLSVNEAALAIVASQQTQIPSGMRARKAKARADSFGTTIETESLQMVSEARAEYRDPSLRSG